MEPNGLTELLLLGGAGLGVGALHVFSPDHWVALLPLSLDAGRRGWRIGLQWGLGHAIALVGIGLAARGLRDWLDLSLLDQGGDWVIGAVLVGVGAWGLAHREHRGHGSGPGREASPPNAGQASHVHTVMAFGVGALHGVGGSGAFLVALPALGFEGWSHAVAYVLGFGSGTIVAMMSFSALLGSLAARLDPNGRFGRGYRSVFRAACWVAIVGGVLWVATPDWVHEEWLLHRHPGG